MELKQVTKEEFWKIIFDGKLDVHPVILDGPYPYTSVFKYRRDGVEFGRVTAQCRGAVVVHEYWVAN